MDSSVTIALSPPSLEEAKVHFDSKKDTEFAYNSIVALFREFGASDYIGEAITQSQHALQAGRLAKLAGSDDETVVAALLHDVGHLCAFSSENASFMGTYGAVNHEKLGANYLKSLGFGEKVCTLVQRHVDAKRYLTHRQPGYMQKLSEASRKTLEYQGGPMSEEEALAFEKDPLKQIIILLRTWDEKAKRTDWEVPEFEAYREMIARLTAPKI